MYTVRGWDTKEEIVFDRHELFLIKDNCFTALTLNTGNMYHSHTFWEIFFLISGKGIHYLNGEKIPLNIGDAYILRPGDKHFVEMCPSTPPNGYSQRDIYVTEAQMQNLCHFLDSENDIYSVLKNSPETPRFHLQDYEIQSIQTMATHRNGSGAPTSYKLMVAMMIDLYLAYDPQSSGGKPAWIEQLAATIRRERDKNKPLEEYIRQTGYCHAHVCREFKKYTGMRLNEYMMSCKLEYSTALLAQRNNSIAQIAYHLGFSNGSNYISCFRRHYGVTPNSWRKTHG